MADWSLIATGAGIGVAVAAPIGPVNIMCVHRAVRRGFRAGLSAGIGAVFADGTFAAIAAFGLSAVAGFIEGHIEIVKLVGGLVLVLFGLVVGTRRPTPTRHEDEYRDSGLSGLGAGVASFVLAITNPTTLIGFLAIVGGIGGFAAGPDSYASAAILVAGVMLGSLAWWATVSGLVAHFRSRFRDEWLHIFNVVAGGALTLFGVALMVDAAVDQFL